VSSRVDIGAVLVLIVLLVVPVATGMTSAEASRTTATVERVIDGDTLVVRGGAHVRLVQIDAPEAGEECYAALSTLELLRLAPSGTRVELESDPALDQVDRYGRLLRYVRVGTRNVNVELVRRGAATPWFYGGERGRYAARFLAAVSTARAERRGMWRACRVFWRPDAPVDTRSR
jgi:micrococcal nuclease